VLFESLDPGVRIEALAVPAGWVHWSRAFPIIYPVPLDASRNTTPTKLRRKT